MYPTLSVHLLPTLIPPGALRGEVAVVVDVLRASTVMVHALGAGVESIRPCLEIDEARRLAASLPAGTALLAGERTGLPIEGFDLGNSPGDFTPERCEGRTLVMTTTNGTRAILASREADQVLIGAFANLGAVRHALTRAGRNAHIVCAGTDGLVSFEDTLLAGALADELERAGWSLGNDPARIAARAWASRRGEDLRSVLATGRGGLRVTELGLEKDIAAAARVDTFEVVPECAGDPPRIAGAGATG